MYSIPYVTRSIKMCTYVYTRFTKSWISTNLNIVGHLIKRNAVSTSSRNSESVWEDSPIRNKTAPFFAWEISCGLGEILHRFGIITNPLKKKNRDIRDIFDFNKPTGQSVSLNLRTPLAGASTNHYQSKGTKSSSQPQPIHFQLNPFVLP